VRARPEILAPAGDRAAMEAAVQAGADAVYFGLQSFNARARAENFSEKDLPETLRYLHEHGVKGYVALNTLVFDNEFDAVEQTIRACANAGVDAVIVQDLGVARLCATIAPEMHWHASTQMTCTDASAIRWAQDLGARRVVLPREFTLEDIAAVGQQTDMELEVFVHGALCVAYSGQCLTSEAIGGRSANRGACAQACRLPYELSVDGNLQPLGERSYLLSPQDLETSALVPQLIKLGVRSFKIEGRLKGADYVASTTRLYREAIAAAMGEGPRLSDATRQASLQMYSRGSGTGFFEGVNHQQLVDGQTCGHRGIEVGVVKGLHNQQGRTWVEVETCTELSLGDGLLIEGGRSSVNELGGRVWSLRTDGLEMDRVPAGTEARIWLGPNTDPRATRPGRRVFRTDDPTVRKEIERHRSAGVTRELNLHVTGAIGEPISIRATTVDGVTASVTGDAVLEIAQQHALDATVLRDKLGRLGGTPYHLGTLTFDLTDNGVVPTSSLNRLRRAMVAKLASATHRQHGTTDLHHADVLANRTHDIELPSRSPPPAGLYVLCRTLSQAQAALQAGADGVYLDFLELTGTGDAFRKLKADGASFVGVAPPRIRKPGEEKIDRFLMGLAPDAVLVRGLGALRELREGTVDAYGKTLYVGDFSLNITNALSAREILGAGLHAFTPSFDLDGKQLPELLKGSLGPFAEVVIHHPMPLFHMEHCVIAALLSTGRDHRTCGRPCDRHQVSLRDRAGMDHPVEADVGCRNTVFHAAPQSAAHLVPAMARLGVRRFRIELVREDASTVASLVKAYRALIAGVVDAATVRQQLKTASGYGVVSGSLRVI
jgi:U32 family peptidase